MISSVEPSYSHVYASNRTLQSFFISGQGFGWKQEDLNSIVVGGNPCRPVWQSPTFVLCEDVDATSWTGASRDAVSVKVNDLATSQAGIFTVFDSPSVSTVAPNAA